MAGPIHTQINGKSRTLESDPETTLLFALREELGLTGTKYGCGIARCGACTIHVDGQPMKACQLQASAEVVSVKDCVHRFHCVSCD